MKVKVFLNTGEYEISPPFIIRKDNNSVSLNRKSTRNIYIWVLAPQIGDFSNLI